MLEKQNCWEYKECGREPGGYESDLYGVCLAAIRSEADGLNDGKYGGRICWALAGTFMNGKARGKYADEKFSCVNCDFFKLVSEEQGIDNFEIVTPTQATKHKKMEMKSFCRFVEKRSSDRFFSNLKASFSCCGRDFTGAVKNISETGLYITTYDMCFPHKSSFNVRLNTGNDNLNLHVKMCRFNIAPDLLDSIGVEVLDPPHIYLLFIDHLRSAAKIS